MIRTQLRIALCRDGQDSVVIDGSRRIACIHASVHRSVDTGPGIGLAGAVRGGIGVERDRRSAGVRENRSGVIFRFNFLHNSIGDRRERSRDGALGVGVGGDEGSCSRYCYRGMRRAFRSISLH